MRYVHLYLSAWLPYFGEKVYMCRFSTFSYPVVYKTKTRIFIRFLPVTMHKLGIQGL